MNRDVGRAGRAAGMAATVFLLAACGGAREARDTSTAPKIDEAWLARVPPEDMAPVEDARTQLRAQEDELSRARVAKQDAENQRTVARNEEETAKAAVKTAESQLKAAEAQGQAPEIAEARAALERARLARQVAEANRQRADQAVEVADARIEAQEAEVKLARNFVSQAEYRALLANGDTRAAELDPAAFDQAIATSQNEANQAQARVQQREQKLQTAARRHDQLRQQLQASQPAPPAG
jgi:chromosome segregation ATPase